METNNTNWKTWKVGRKTTFHVEEFDGPREMKGVITEVHPDHLIFRTEGIHDLMIEDWNAHLFR